MLFRRPTPVRAAEGGGGGSPATPAPAAPEALAAPADAAPAAPGTLLGGAPAAQPSPTPPADGQPQGEGKPGDKPAEGKEGDKPEPKPLTAEDFASGIKMPDDLPITNPEGLAAFRSLAAEAGLSVDQAQRLVDFQAGQIRAQQQAAQATIADWSKQAAADKEFGGEAFAANAGIARQALQAFATPALVELFNQTGIGNHPEMIRAFYRVGKAMAEDGRVAASGAPKGDRLAALYPTMVSKE
ncbi:hypothetical protein [Phaeospirillum tilakii]|uniref:Peptidase n=1 Tax=Phaeospirillum tilakii TaxID=741673 RepID=A0ABW5C7D9_9PROT